MSTIEKNVIIVGDSLVGKTSILMRSIEHRPRISDILHTKVYIDGQQVELNIFEVNGMLMHKYDLGRRVAYADIDVILMCYSFDSSISLSHIMTTWLPEVRQFCPNVPIVLVGNKVDLVDDPAINTSKIPVPTEEALHVNRKLNPFAHILSSNHTAHKSGNRRHIHRCSKGRRTT